MTDAEPADADTSPAETPRAEVEATSSRASPTLPRLGGTAIAVGLVAAPWAWYAGIPPMYIVGSVLAAGGVGLLVATRLPLARSAPQAVLAAGAAVLLIIAATLVPGWRPGSAGGRVTVWRAEVSAHDALMAVPAGGTLWVFDNSTIRPVDRRTGDGRARIEAPRSMEVRRTGWGIAVRHWHERGDNGDSIAGYRPDGTRAWRFTDPRRRDMELRATRDGVTAVVACREFHADRPTPKTCRATGLDANGERVWTRRVSPDGGATARLDGVHVLLSREHGRWHFVDPKTGQDLADPAPKGFAHPWVTGDLAVFTRPRSGDACDVVAFRDGRRAWQDTMRGSACKEGPEPYEHGWALYSRGDRAEQDDSYIADVRRESADAMPDFPGDWVGYDAGVLISKTRHEEPYAVYGTEVTTGDRRWSRDDDVGDEYATTSVNSPVVFFRNEPRPVSGDDYSPDARIVTVYSAVTGQRLYSTRVAEGVPDDLTPVNDGAVLLWYDDHVTYLSPRP